MRETITVDVSENDWEQYGSGLKSALNRAMEKLTESDSIKALAKLYNRLDDKWHEVSEARNKRKAVDSLKTDVKDLQDRINEL